MRHLFLTSQVQYVANSIQKKVDVGKLTHSVFIDTCIQDTAHSNLEWHHKNKSRLEEVGFKFDVYNIAGKTESEINSDLSKYEVMYVEGGNSYYLLQESQKNNFGSFVRKRIEEGMIYIGTSAGSVITGPDIEPVRREETTPLAPELKGTKAFRIVPFVILPHWGNSTLKKLYGEYRFNHVYNEDFPYILLTDQQYVEVVGDFYRIIDVRNES